MMSLTSFVADASIALGVKDVVLRSHDRRLEHTILNSYLADVERSDEQLTCECQNASQVNPIMGACPTKSSFALVLKSSWREGKDRQVQCVECCIP